MCDCGKGIPGLDLPADCTHCIGIDPDDEWEEDIFVNDFMDDEEAEEDDNGDYQDEDDFFPDDETLEDV
jgi:hypothetical protein